MVKRFFRWFPALSGMARAQGEEAKAAALEQVQVGIQLLEEAFEKVSQGKEFFGGEKIGYLDIAFGCYLGWLRATEIMTGVKFLDESKRPHLTAWAERFSAQAAVKEVMPETEKLVEFGKMLQAKSQAPPQN
ncbi:Glutathione S-transferase U1 [Asimina triloba]